MGHAKYLVPIDFSAHSEAALEYATAFAKDQDAELLIVHVVEPAIEDLEGVTQGAAMEGLVAALHERKPSDESVSYAHRLLQGTPAEAILEVADEESVALIVMGTHGRRGLNRFVMGSVAEKIVRKAACPVLTIKQPIAAEATA
ncbi:MAG: universal stress protein [Planctomycetota bacterium]